MSYEQKVNWGVVEAVSSQSAVSTTLWHAVRKDSGDTEKHNTRSGFKDFRNLKIRRTGISLGRGRQQAAGSSRRIGRMIS